MAGHDPLLEEHVEPGGAGELESMQRALALHQAQRDPAEKQAAHVVWLVQSYAVSVAKELATTSFEGERKMAMGMAPPPPISASAGTVTVIVPSSNASRVWMLVAEEPVSAAEMSSWERLLPPTGEVEGVL